MKKTILLIYGLLLIASANGRDAAIRQKIADSYFNRYDYFKAIPMYEDILRSDPENMPVYGRLAESYRRINDSENAERCYSVLVQKEDADPEIMLNYARMLARNGKYAQAAEWFHKYAEAVPGDSRGTSFPEIYRDLNALLKDSAEYKVEKVSFNSEESDFSPAFYGNSIVFSSARKKQTAVKTSYNWTNSSYLDLYIADPYSDNAKPFPGKINSNYHEGPLTFSRNLDTVIFTRSNFHEKRLGKDSIGVNRLKLYTATRKNSSDDWGNIEPMPFNNDEYSVGHPSLSADGNTLFFASDMPGGSGGTDIYLSRKTTGYDGSVSWSKPENLGKEINSEGNELFPFSDNTDRLWYASNGLAGLGGLDIFVSDRTNSGFDKPENAGYPVNTRFDDFGYITNDSGRDGFLSSDRFSSNGNDDIYSIRRTGINMIFKVLDAKTGEIIQGAGLLVEGSQYTYSNLVSDNKGLAEMFSPDIHQIKITADKAKYEQGSFTFNSEKISGSDTLYLALNRVPVEIKLTGKVLSASDFLPVTTGKIWIINKTVGSRTEALCDQQGVFSHELDPATGYTIEVELNIPDRKCVTVKAELTTDNPDKSVEIRQLFPVYCVGDVIRVENIYYDLGKADIRPEAAVELDKVFDIMQKNPGMTIELRSHTDSRGSADSNMALSQRRALSASEYLYRKGIPRERIVFKGYGETIPLNNCTDGVKCPEEEFQLNRRTEFKILSLEQ